MTKNATVSPDQRWKSTWLDYIHLHSQKADTLSSAAKQITARQLEDQRQGRKWARKNSVLRFVVWMLHDTRKSTISTPPAVLRASLIKQQTLKIVPGHVPDQNKSRNLNLQVWGCCTSHRLGLMPNKTWCTLGKRGRLAEKKKKRDWSPPPTQKLEPRKLWRVWKLSNKKRFSLDVEEGEVEGYYSLLSTVAHP